MKESETNRIKFSRGDRDYVWRIKLFLTITAFFRKIKECIASMKKEDDALKKKYAENINKIKFLENEKHDSRIENFNKHFGR